jgi:hypothetical protein
MQKIPYKTDQNNPTIRAYNEAVEKGQKNQHVVPYGDKWAVTDLSSGKAKQVFIDERGAIEYAQSHAAQGTIVFIHSNDGRIKERIDY